MRRRLAPIFISILIAGCDNAPPPPATPRVPAASVQGSGVISGKVFFDGVAPPQKIVRNEPCCPGAPPTQIDETVVVNDNRTLANVFVYVLNGPATDGAKLPPAMLDQQFCRYIPHAIGVVVNQPLTLKSSDPTTHNVNIRPEIGRELNKYMTRAGETRTITLADLGFAHSKCDVHPWMSATIGVFDNPFFAVTNGRGEFEIKGLPDGTYRVAVKHEFYPSLPVQTVTIAAGKPVSLDFRYPPAP